MSCTRPSERGGRPASPSSSTTSSACAPSTVSRARWSPQDGAPVPAATGAVRAHGAASLSDPDRQGLHHPARSRQVQGAAARISAAWSRPPPILRRAAAVRHDRRHPQCRPGECARHAQHPRRALGHLPRRFRPASLRGSASARRAAGLRVSSAGCPTRSSARPSSTPPTGATPISRRCRCTASCSRSRTRFDTKDMRSTGGGDARYDIDFPGARPRAGRAAPQQGRDHLRQGGQHRIQRARRRPRRPPPARQGAALDASAISAAPGAAIPPTPTTRRARPRSARARDRRCRSAPTW